MRRDPSLSRSLERVCEEREAIVAANEALGRPRADAADRFTTLLLSEPSRWRTGRPMQGCSRAAARLRELFGVCSFSNLAVAASYVLLAQAAVIGALLMRYEPQHYEPQSRVDTHIGCFAIAAFDPDAKLPEIGAFLEAAKAVIVDGPKPRGLYLMRLSSQADANTCDAMISGLGAELRLVRFISRAP